MKTQTETDYLAESEAHAQLYYGVPVDSDLFVKLRTGASNDAASNDDVLSADEVDAWARHAAAASGFGDAVMDFPRPTSFELHKAAFAHRALVLGGLMLAAASAIDALLRKEYARLRRAYFKETMMSISFGKPNRRKLRASIAAAFRKIARAVDERTAHRMTQSFYRSSRMAWTRGLN